MRAQPVAEPQALGRVEPACGLVEQQHAGLRDQRPGDRHQLAPALGQLARGPIGDIVEAEQSERGRDVAASGRAARRGREADDDVLADRQVVVEIDRLEGAPEAGADPLGAGFRPSSASPPSVMEPVAAVKPLIASSRVVLPAPLGPMSPTIVPSGTSKLTPSTAMTPPYCTRRSRTESRSGDASPAVAVAEPERSAGGTVGDVDVGVGDRPRCLLPTPSITVWIGPMMPSGLRMTVTMSRTPVIAAYQPPSDSHSDEAAKTMPPAPSIPARMPPDTDVMPARYDGREQAETHEHREVA